jgi:hypothetical protein
MRNCKNRKKTLKKRYNKRNLAKKIYGGKKKYNKDKPQHTLTSYTENLTDSLTIKYILETGGGYANIQYLFNGNKIFEYTGDHKDGIPNGLGDLEEYEIVDSKSFFTRTKSSKLKSLHSGIFEDGLLNDENAEVEYYETDKTYTYNGAFTKGKGGKISNSDDSNSELVDSGTMSYVFETKAVVLGEATEKTTDIYKGDWKGRMAPTLPNKQNSSYTNSVIGKREGWGMMKYDSRLDEDYRRYYDGEWVDDKREGIGGYFEVVNGNDRRSYIGQWKNDEKNGWGYENILDKCDNQDFNIKTQDEIEKEAEDKEIDNEDKEKWRQVTTQSGGVHRENTEIPDDLTCNFNVDVDFKLQDPPTVIDGISLFENGEFKFTVDITKYVFNQDNTINEEATEAKLLESNDEEETLDMNLMENFQKTKEIYNSLLAELKPAKGTDRFFKKLYEIYKSSWKRGKTISELDKLSQKVEDKQFEIDWYNGQEQEKDYETNILELNKNGCATTGYANYLSSYNIPKINEDFSMGDWFCNKTRKVYDSLTKNTTKGIRWLMRDRAKNIKIDEQGKKNVTLKGKRLGGKANLTRKM